MPTVMNRNCIMSVSVIDHMPPRHEYAMTTSEPSRMAEVRPMGNSTVKIEA